MSDVTRILSQIEEGDDQAAGKLLPLVYDELRKLAYAKMAQENPGQTLQATALLHEAYIRLVDVELPQHWESRGHFFSAAAEAMRRILVDNARSKQAQVRGGGRERLALIDVDLVSRATPDEIVAVNDTVTKLATEDPTAAEIVKLRMFGGMSIDDASDALGISRATGYRHWTYARAWMRAELHGLGEEEKS